MHIHEYQAKKALKRIRGTHAGGTACRHTRRSGAGRTDLPRPGVGWSKRRSMPRGQGQGWRREGVPQPGKEAHEAAASLLGARLVTPRDRAGRRARQCRVDRAGHGERPGSAIWR